jgi:flagellar protein FlbT
MKLSLRRGERIFINGAVLKVDRKVSIELLNDAAFLLENYFMEERDAPTPLERLYLAIQRIVLAPDDRDAALQACREALVALAAGPGDERVAQGLGLVIRKVEAERPLEALKALRALLPAADDAETGAVREVA